VLLGEALVNSGYVRARRAPGGRHQRARRTRALRRRGRHQRPVTSGRFARCTFHTPLGRLATFICYDGWFRERYGSARSRERASSAPTNSVPIPGQDKNREAMANILCMASARTRSSSPRRPGRVERGQPFVGQSLIVGYTGWPIAGPASPRRKASIG